jgi:hypothetical protein
MEHCVTVFAAKGRTFGRGILKIDSFLNHRSIRR